MKCNIICRGVILAAIGLYGATIMGQTARFEIVPSNEAYPVVYDNATNLTWQGCTGGQGGKRCTGVATRFTWQEALDYCARLHWGMVESGHWRLPSIVELRSIIDNKKVSPSINPDYFPETNGDYYWSSSSYVNNGDLAWYVHFSDGYVYNLDKGNNNYARCVRSGP